MNCKFEACDRPATKRGMCQAHYTQWHRGMELKPLRVRRNYPKDATGRVCTSCEVYKPWSEFYVHHTQGGRRATCKECDKEYDRTRTASGVRKRVDS